MASKITSTVAARVPNDIKATIENALKEGNSNIKEIMIDFGRKVNSGELEISDGKIIIPQIYEEKSEYNLDDLIDACESKGVKVQDAINKAAQMVWRG